jgi:hypothetical protein
MATALPSPPRAQAKRRRNPTLLILHAVVVLGLVAGYIAIGWEPTVDANIGAGGLGVLLMGLGLPWSCFTYLVPGGHPWDVAVMSTALFNLGIHGATFWLWLRKSTSD